MKTVVLFRSIAIAACVVASVVAALHITAPKPIGVAQMEAHAMAQLER